MVIVDIKARDEAIKLLNQKFGNQYGTIVTIKPIHNGYTNYSFFIEYSKGNKFQVRLPHCGKLIDRHTEAQIIEILGDKSFVYFDPESGNAIRKWIDGSCPKIHKHLHWRYVDRLFVMIRQFHLIPLPKKHNFKKIDFDAYNDNLYRLKLEYQTKYLSIIDSYSDDIPVLSHTDINAQNMIIDDKRQLHLIDYEWTALVSDYWDYANFIRETGIMWYEQIDWRKYIPKFDMIKLKNYIFASSVYSFLWTWKMPQTRKIKKYRRKVLKQIKIFARGVVGNEE